MMTTNLNSPLPIDGGDIAGAEQLLSNLRLKALPKLHEKKTFLNIYESCTSRFLGLRESRFVVVLAT